MLLKIVDEQQRDTKTMDSSGYRVEAERWLTIAEKLLAARDLHGAKTFAIRARECDPRLLDFADQIIAVSDTLLAGELMINHHADYYAILQVPRFTLSMELIATQYRKLALILNPTRNRLSFADQAFKLVSEAWLMLSDHSKRAMYDHELQLSLFGQQLGHSNQFVQQPQPLPPPPPPRQESQPTLVRPRPTTRDGKAVMEEFNMVQPSFPEPTRPIRPAAQPPTQPATQTKAPVQRTVPESTRTPTQTTALESTRTPQSEPAAKPGETESRVPSFWTACPYCYIMYEYPKIYEECTLRCQNCKRAFHAVIIPSPPVTGKDTYFCCWGFFPLGGRARGRGGLGSWSPFSGMFATPLQAGGRPINKPKVIYKDDVYIELSDPSDDDSDSDDDDWGSKSRKRRAKNFKGKGTSKNVKKSQNERTKKGNVNQNVDGGGANVREDGVVGRKGEGSSGKKKAAKDLGKLDLNVMFSNEVEEAVPGVSEGNGTGHGEEDNIEGIGFFEGLDEFLSSLPILSVVGGDDKVKAN